VSRGSRRLPLVAAAALLALVVLDLARPYVGPALKPWQVAAAAVLLALAWTALRARGLRRGEALAFVALPALLVPVYLDHSRTLESDGVHYYGYLRSLLFDLDLDLSNDYALLGWDHRGPNVLPVGAPLLWSPLVIAVHLSRQAGRLFGLAAPSGVEPLYQGAVSLATLAYGSAGLVLLLDTLRRFSPVGDGPRLFPLAAAFWAAVLCWIGSPLRFYLSVLPGLAHGAEFFVAVLALRAYLALRAEPSVRRAALAGAACGVLFLVRSQDALLLFVPAAELAVRALRLRSRPALLALAACLAAFAVAALPQLAVWQAMFGVPVLVPHKALHGEEFMHLTQPQLAGTLVSPRGGLFTSHPVLLAGLAGLLLLAFRDARYVALALPVLAAMWYVNSTVFDWYHVRRFTGVVPLLAPGLALVLAPLTRAGVVPLALLAFLALRYDRAVDSLRALPGEPAPVRAALAETSDGLARDAYGLLEPRAPAWAAALLGAYTGEQLLGEGVSRIDLTRETPLLRLPLPARHLSEVASEDGAACRWVTSQEARLFLPLAAPSAIVLSVRARALETLEPQSIEALWNDVPVGRQPTRPAWQDYRFEIPAPVVRAGTNVLVLRFARGPIYRRMRNDGPREVRPAALQWILLHRRTG
jgi:hypothetical protein